MSDSALVLDRFGSSCFVVTKVWYVYDGFYCCVCCLSDVFEFFAFNLFALGCWLVQVSLRVGFAFCAVICCGGLLSWTSLALDFGRYGMCVWSFVAFTWALGLT